VPERVKGQKIVLLDAEVVAQVLKPRLKPTINTWTDRPLKLL